MTHVERFAPSPNGYLHLGHAFSALTAFEAAEAAGGRFLLRIEDIDRTRARPEFEAAIYADLAWLGLQWEIPVMRQSERLPAYAEALARLKARGLIYPCACTRRDIAEALDAPQEGAGPMIGPDGPVYPGTCKRSPPPEGAPVAWRLDMERAVAALGGAAGLGFEELGEGPDGETGRIALSPGYLIDQCGDVVLARRDIATSYHLSVVVDDAAQGVSHVTRGRDLFPATPIHVLLQGLLGLPTPAYRHHRLIRDAEGRRLAKRDGDESLASLRAAGVAPEEVRRIVGL
jgi:glutamyl-Q tRNA(Asp) synthetase